MQVVIKGNSGYLQRSSACYMHSSCSEWGSFRSWRPWHFFIGSPLVFLITTSEKSNNESENINLSSSEQLPFSVYIWSFGFISCFILTFSFRCWIFTWGRWLRPGIRIAARYFNLKICKNRLCIKNHFGSFLSWLMFTFTSIITFLEGPNTSITSGWGMLPSSSA